MERNYTSGELMIIKAVKKTKPPICIYCNKFIPRKQMSIDHLTPISRGGETVYENLGLCHKHCNVDKGDMTHEEYMEVLREEERVKEQKRRIAEEMRIEKEKQAEKERQKQLKTLEKYESRKEKIKNDLIQRQERNRLHREEKYNKKVNDSSIIDPKTFFGDSKNDPLAELFRRISR